MRDKEIYKFIADHVKVALGQDFAKPGFGCAIEFYISMTSGPPYLTRFSRKVRGLSM
jgi:hypothetical protein